MLSRHPLRFLRSRRKIILLGSGNRRNARVTNQCDETSISFSVFGSQLMFGIGEPGGRSKDFGYLAGGVREGSEEAAEESLH